jgi:uncharacterized protein YegL
MFRMPAAASKVLIALAIGVAALVPPMLSSQERDVAGEFKAAKSNLTQQLKDKKKENRLAALRKLETFQTPDAAKLLLFQGLSSTDEDIRRGSFDVLAKFNGDGEICNFLKATVAKQWRQGKPQAETYAGLALLLASDLPDVREEATALVLEALERPQGRHILITLADELGNCRGDSPCRSLVQLIELPLFHQDFAFRRAVEQALTHVRAKPAVTALIKLLAAAKGEVRADIVHYLTDLSGQQLGLDAQAWSTWWKQQEEKFEFPPEKKQLVAANIGPAPARPAPAGPSYYGLPLSGAKMVFVIDTSGSMTGPRIFAAKRELSRAIEELPADVEFSIVSFAGQPLTWQARLVPASAENKQSALYFVAAVQGVGKGTASYDALETAMRFDTEVIYFLTDGAPVGGKITNPPDIVRTITRTNQFRRITMNSLGIGVDTPVFESFLSTLAQQNFGVYERVDR